MYDRLFFRQMNLVHYIKWVLDAMVIGLYIGRNDFSESSLLSSANRIACSGIGYLFGARGNGMGEERLRINKLREVVNYSFFEDFFLRTVNDVHNAYKHDILTASSHALEIPWDPYVCVGKFERSNESLGKVKFYYFELRSLIGAFNDFIVSLLNGGEGLCEERRFNRVLTRKGVV